MGSQVVSISIRAVVVIWWPGKMMVMVVIEWLDDHAMKHNEVMMLVVE